jgi:hypothetical protein
MRNPPGFRASLAEDEDAGFALLIVEREVTASWVLMALSRDAAYGLLVGRKKNRCIGTGLAYELGFQPAEA